MRKSLLRRLGVVALALTATTWALTAPVQAEPTTGTISGHLTDDSGAPVANADVYADGPEYLFASADETGFYQFTEMPPGDYRIYFDPSDAPGQYAYQQTDWWEADVFTVAAGEAVTVNDSLLPTGTITGRFTDAGGNPVDAWVNAESDGGGGYHSGPTDAEGYFSLAVRPGTFRVEFDSGGVSQYAYGTTSYDDAELVEVQAGETVTVNDTKLATGTITGRFTAADGTPVADAFVNAEPESGREHGGWTDEDGYFEITVLPGTYVVSFDTGSARQYAYGTTDFAQAERFTVGADETVTVNDTQLPTGSVAGRFTDANGAGIADVQVSVDEAGPGGGYGYANTDADGHWQVDGLFVGDYIVHFSDYERGISQYAYGKISEDAADVFAVTANATTTVNDTQLPTGRVRITATDNVTGAVIQSFWASTFFFGGGTDNGELLLENVPIGEYQFEVGAEGYLWKQNAGTVTVVADETAELVATLTPAAGFDATIVDAETGEPVSGICVMAVPLQRFSLFCAGDTSDEAGKVTVSYLKAGTYQLFAYPGWDAGGYGAQWVGRAGGTGNQLLAKPFRLDIGEKVSVTIQMDRAGIVTGQVTNPDGSPAERGSVGIIPEHGFSGDEVGNVYLDDDGRYTIDFLGPYRWPLRFAAAEEAAQWTGGAPSRLMARRVPVVAGETTTYDYQLRSSTTVNAALSGVDDNAVVIAYDAITGDIVTMMNQYPDNPDTITTQIKGPIFVKFRMYGGYADRWYGGDSFADAKPVFIPSHGSKDINLNF